MSSPILTSPAHSLTAGLLFFVAAIGAHAQSRVDAASHPALAGQRAALASAKAAATRGDFSAAARSLDDGSTLPANSVARAFETAQRLTQLAQDLSRAGNGAGAQSAAATALQYLARASQRTNDSGWKAAIQNQAGFLYDRYLGDTVSAKTAYRAAALLAPGNDAFREKADKFETADDEAKRKAAANR